MTIRRPQVRHDYNQNDLAKYLNKYLLDLAVDVSALQSSGGGGGGGANLTMSRNTTSVTILSDTGTDAVIPLPDATNAGVVSAGMRDNWDYVFGAAVAYASATKTDISIIIDGYNVSGVNVGPFINLGAATSVYAGLMIAADKVKLNNLSSNTVYSVDFGASFTDKAQFVVTGLSWVTATSKIIPHVLTPSGVDPDEMYLLGIRAEISDIVVGTGFTVTLYSESEAKGAYDVMIIGV